LAIRAGALREGLDRLCTIVHVFADLCVA